LRRWHDRQQPVGGKKDRGSSGLVVLNVSFVAHGLIKKCRTLSLGGNNEKARVHIADCRRDNMGR
jgi:hypothetical protein